MYSGKPATISTYVADRFGNYNILTGTTINFYTEAGAIDRQGILNSAGTASVLFRTQAPLPADVQRTQTTDPDFSDFAAYYTQNEPYHAAYNPRDGWVTVLATTMGEEAFLDENGDGMFTSSYSTTACPPGYTCECADASTGAYMGFVTAGTCPGGQMRSEGFVDLGEPFIDVNDNGKRDDGSVAGYPFEQFIDANGNGFYDPPNGRWDGRGVRLPVA